jgi:CO dehydrogenase/acetyl-CoA synthase beta subunit
MFDHYLQEIFEHLRSKELRELGRSYSYNDAQNWPRTESQMIFDSDTAVELGHPQTESAAILLWTESPEKINDRQITLFGPDLNEGGIKRMPFGKIVLISAHGFNEENAFQRYQEMEAIKFALNLDGYMLRAIPQENKEWSRVSKRALQSGFSLPVLGNELIRAFHCLEYVDAAEIIFITSSVADVQKFKPIAEKVKKVSQAMNRMFDDLEYDCSSCNFSDVCNEIDGLKTMHQKSRTAAPAI